MQPVATRSREAGFTLVEALIAIVVLSFGLIAVTNLLLIASTSNTIANQSSGATAIASRVMEDIHATSFGTLTAGGTLGVTTCGSPDGTPPGDFCRTDSVPGVGTVRTSWRITAVNANTLHIVVQSEGTGALAGPRSRAEFTTYRTCAGQGCP